MRERGGQGRGAVMDGLTSPLPRAAPPLPPPLPPLLLLCGLPFAPSAAAYVRIICVYKRAWNKARQSLYLSLSIYI